MVGIVKTHVARHVGEVLELEWLNAHWSGSGAAPRHCETSKKNSLTYVSGMTAVSVLRVSGFTLIGIGIIPRFADTQAIVKKFLYTCLRTLNVTAIHNKNAPVLARIYLRCTKWRIASRKAARHFATLFVKCSRFFVLCQVP